MGDLLDMDHLDRLAASASTGSKEEHEDMAEIVAGVANKLNIGKQPKYPASLVDSILDDSDEENNVFEDDDEEVMHPSSHPLAIYSNSKTPPKMSAEQAAGFAAVADKEPRPVLIKALDRQPETPPSASTTAENEYNTGDDESDESESDDDSAQKSGNSDSAEDYSDDEDEGEDGYKAGGYHPVKVSEVYNQR